MHGLGFWNTLYLQVLKGSGEVNKTASREVYVGTIQGYLLVSTPPLLHQ